METVLELVNQGYVDTIKALKMISDEIDQINADYAINNHVVNVVLADYARVRGMTIYNHNCIMVIAQGYDFSLTAQWRYSSLVYNLYYKNQYTDYRYLSQVSNVLFGQATGCAKFNTRYGVSNDNAIDSYLRYGV